MELSPPPMVRAGRVFVPLRGIFEQLGASVVYSDGTINAQGRGHSVSIHIGSTDATVDGQPQTLDVAPFIIGASTFVPLRFVSQALGAGVNYDNSRDLVAITRGGDSRDMHENRDRPEPAAPAAMMSSLRLRDLSPGRDATVTGRRPAIEAQFANVNVDPNSLHIVLDDVDVTSSTSRSPSGFVFSPPSDLQSMQHTLRVTGRDTAGNAFDQSWQFVSGHQVVENTISDLSPNNGAAVGGQFTVRGRTLPGARVVIQVGTSNGNERMENEVGAIFGMSVRNEVIANGEGYFSSQVSINAVPGAHLLMTVNSTDPRSNTAAPPVNRTLALR
jgi:hypothetical protein